MYIPLPYLIFILGSFPATNLFTIVQCLLLCDLLTIFCASSVLAVRYLYTGITSTRITLQTTMLTPAAPATLLCANVSCLRRLRMGWCKSSRLILLSRSPTFLQSRSERMSCANIRYRLALNFLSSLSSGLCVPMGLIAIICYINIYVAHTIHTHTNPRPLHPLCPSGANCLWAYCVDDVDLRYRSSGEASLYTFRGGIITYILSVQRFVLSFGLVSLFSPCPMFCLHLVSCRGEVEEPCSYGRHTT